MLCKGWPTRRQIKNLPRWVDRHRFLLLGAVLLVQLAGINGQWRLGPDSCKHAVIGRNLAQGLEYGHLVCHAERVHPGLAYLIGWNLAVFGPEAMWPVVLLYHAMGVGILLATYHLFAIHANRATAVAVTCLLGISATFYFQTLQVLPDLPFLLGLMMVLVACEQATQRRGHPILRWLLAGSGLALMVAFRFVALVVLAALMADFLIRALRDRRWIRLAVAAAVVLLLVVVRWHDPRRGDSNWLMPDESEVVAKLVRRLPQTLAHAVVVNVPDLLFEVGPKALVGNKLGPKVADGLLTALALGASVLLLMRRRLLWGLLVIFFVLQWLLFLPSTRYFLVIMPLLAYGWWTASRWLLGAGGRKWAAPVAATMLLLWVLMNGGRVAGLVLTQRSVPFDQHYEHGRYRAIREAGHWLAAHTRPEATIATWSKWTAPMRFYCLRRIVNTRGRAPLGPGPIYVVYSEPPDPATARHLMDTPGPIAIGSTGRFRVCRIDK